MHIFNNEQFEELGIYKMQLDMKIWKQALDMRGKQSKHMSAQDYMSNIQALTTQPLT